MTSDEIRTSPPEKSRTDGRWRKTLEFLNRDVRTFLPGQDKRCGDLILEPPAVEDAAQIESLVDPERLDFLALRRNVLDWRDNFHAHVTETALSLHEKFVQHIDAELEDVGFFRQLLTKPASEVLQGPFIQEIRVPLYSSLRREEDKRAALNDSLDARWQFNFSCKMQWSDSECESLRDIGFKPTNREKILAKVKALVLGDDGVAARYREQATHFALRLIEEKRPC